MTQSEEFSKPALLFAKEDRVTLPILGRKGQFFGEQAKYLANRVFTLCMTLGFACFSARALGRGAGKLGKSAGEDRGACAVPLKAG